MASSRASRTFICHFCFEEYCNRSSLLSHFSKCNAKNSTKRYDETTDLPRLNKSDRNLLHMLQLHRRNDKSTSNKPKDKTNLQIPLTFGYIPSSQQSSFDDSICNPTNNEIFENKINNDPDEKDSPTNINSKSSVPCHTYKYSRREQKNFYASVKRARLKKHHATYKKSSKSSFIFNKEKYSINLPTKINSRQRLNTNSNNSYPLIFDPNFHSLVQISTNNLFHNYFTDIHSYFHLIHSIASQEFQIIINSNDQQNHVSYTAYSFLNILRQTMTDYSLNIQKNLKRNYFQSFQSNSQQIQMPFKIRRCDPIILDSTDVQINDNHHQFETLTNNNLPTEIIINNHLSNERTDTITNPVINPVPSDINSRQQRMSKDRITTDQNLTTFIPIVEEPRIIQSPSPILLKKQKLEPIQIESSNFSFETAPTRMVNGTNDNKKRSSSIKKPSKSNNHIDENNMVKATRMNTRKNPIKTEVITEMNPSFETKPIILSSNEISKEWSKNNVFYRCHACSHEEFFLVLSRECINLHISSKHANMEENFRQRLSNFLNNKGRSLKIFQHYLKWQQPWSEKQIEQIFKLSNK